MAQVVLLLCGTGDSYMQLPTLSWTSVRLGKAGQGTAGNLLNQLPLCLDAIVIAERLKLFFLKILCFSRIGWRLLSNPCCLEGFPNACSLTHSV